ADPALQIEAVRDQLKNLEESNQKVAKRKLAQDELDRLDRDFRDASAAHKASEGTLEAVRLLRVHLLDGVDLGIRGLEIGIGELRLGGVPFEQASNAEQITAACMIAMKQNPRLRLLRLDNAESLDAESRQIVFNLASKYCWQVIMTAVSNDK